MGKGEKEGVRILVVDDDMASRKVVCELLSREGYSVEISADAGDALSRHMDDLRQGVRPGTVHVRFSCQ